MTEKELHIIINYFDLAQVLRATNSRNVKELNLHFMIEITFTDGENHRVIFIIPEEIVRASPDELEERSKQ